MQIIPFQQSDQDVTEAFMQKIYQEMGWIGLADGLDDLENFFHLPTGEGFLFIVKDHDKIVATGGCVLLDKQDGLIKRFYIDKNYRGKGLAQELFKKIIDTAKSLAVSRVVIDVGKKNSRAIRFYEKCGFKQYHQTPIARWSESSQPEKFNYYFLNI